MNADDIPTEGETRVVSETSTVGDDAASLVADAVTAIQSGVSDDAKPDAIASTSEVDSQQNNAVQNEESGENDVEMSPVETQQDNASELTDQTLNEGTMEEEDETEAISNVEQHVTVDQDETARTETKSAGHQVTDEQVVDEESTEAKDKETQEDTMGTALEALASEAIVPDSPVIKEENVPSSLTEPDNLVPPVASLSSSSGNTSTPQQDQSSPITTEASLSVTNSIKSNNSQEHDGSVAQNELQVKEERATGPAVSSVTGTVSQPGLVTSVACASDDMGTIPSTTSTVIVSAIQAVPSMATVPATVRPAAGTPHPFTGSINLTISNGAINIKPASAQASGKAPELAQSSAIAPIIRGSLGGPNSGVNMKLAGQALNIRVSPPVSVPKGLSGMAVAPQVLGARPAMIIGQPIRGQVAQLQAQVVPATRGTLKPMHATHIIQSPPTAILSHGTKLIGLPQVAAGRVAGQASINTSGFDSGAKIPLVATIQAAPTDVNMVAARSVSVAAAAAASTPSTSGTGDAGPVKAAGVPVTASMSSSSSTSSSPASCSATGVSNGHQTTGAISVKTEPSESTDPVNTPCNEHIKQESQDKEDKTSDEFDPANAMEWKDGVGTLPGSDLKFRMNEFGIMELITEGEGDALECGEDMDFNNSGEPGAPAQPEVEDSASSSNNSEPASNESKLVNDDFVCCITCGAYGMAGEFHSEQCCSKICSDAQAKLRLLEENKARLSGEKAAGKKKKRKHDSVVDGGSDTKYPRLSDPDDLTDPRLLASAITSAGGKRVKSFSWATYLEQEAAKAAPARLFRNAFPACKNVAKVGMKLEGIDPDHPAYYCVLTVAEVRGYRLRLHFDGYSECYDFWVNADSPFIFPVGWAEKNGKKLQPPKGFTGDTFSWSHYLRVSKFQPAPKTLFTNTNVTTVTPHNFRIGMKLEAVDKKNTALTCVATVSDVLGERILVHFDGWEDSYDYWCEPSSPYIHPVGWCQQTGNILSPPNDWPDIEGFTWEEYLTTTKSQAVPARAFKTRPPNQFNVGMKLEVVDKRNQSLIRCATVVEVEPHTVKIHFDGWLDIYDYWVDDDCPDIHPPGWCAKTGHLLTPPITPSDLTVSPSQGGCPTPGCHGIGHIKGAKYTGHHSAFGCPYSTANMNKESVIPDRLVSANKQDSIPSESPLTITIPKSSFTKTSSISPEFKKCPTPGCDGAGHVTGKYTAHHRVSGCPLVEKSVSSNPPSPSPPILYDDETGRPLVGPGSGRGRKKNKIRQLIRKQQELMKNKVQEVNNMESSPCSSLLQGIHQSVFMSSMTTPTLAVSQELSLCWQQHSKLLPSIEPHRVSEVASWGYMDVVNFIKNLPGCQHLAHTFQEQQIDGEALLLLNQADIVKILNVKLGPALKIYNSIIMIKNMARLNDS